MKEFSFLFDTEEISTTTKIKGNLFINKNEKSKNILLDRFNELNLIFPDKINKDETIHLVSSDNFGSIELLKVVLSRIEAKELNITTWSYNEDFVSLLEDCLKKGMSVKFYVDKSIKTRKIHLYAQIILLKDKYPNLIIKVHHMLHAKITLISSEQDKIIIESSANYSKNQRIENFTITNSETLFNFHKSWMKQLIGK